MVQGGGENTFLNSLKTGKGKHTCFFKKKKKTLRHKINTYCCLRRFFKKRSLIELYYKIVLSFILSLGLAAAERSLFCYYLYVTYVCFSCYPL